MKSADERVLDLLREARRQLELERSRREEPIAIVGIGCRLPGQVSGPEQFWQLLREGIDASSEVPRGRWEVDAFYDPDPEAPGKAYTRRGSFLDAIDAFEPEFFGISPREATGMDPQQRLLLEVVWEALEDAGIVPDSLRGSDTGVWVGLCVDDYAGRSLWSGDASSIDAYSALGNTRSVAAGRISYVLDLRGPTVQLDTACSSSLVAVHQACQSLRTRECSLALVGGVNLLSAPESTIALCKLRALSRDGRCKTFDAAADGYGRGEGCAMVVLERLSDARRAGHRVYALVRGSAVNHDGHSNGLTAPNGLAQEAVLKAALSSAGTEPAAVDLIEAHGTGTLLGDPIEVLALSRVYGVNRSPDCPLLLGTVKTNFGHLEGAAGVAGLIKIALCLSHGEMAPSLHLRTPNPKIPWSSLPVHVLTERRSWRRGERARMAGVSSFGISGTNAHVVLAEAPEAEVPGPAPERSAELVVLSAKTSVALAAMAGRLRQHLEAHPELQLADVAFSLLASRSTLEHRLALAVPSRQILLEALEHAAAASSEEAALPVRALHAPIVFVFPGQGSQWLGMGRSLLEEEPAFQAALSECDRAIQAETGWSVLQELRAAPEQSRLDRVDVVQPVLFALQVALAALWRAWGIEPAAVVGHSMGEVAAACVAGALSLEDGAAVICRRSLLLRQISGQGEMALVELSLEDAQAALAGHEDRLAVAVSNGPRSTVISGHPDALTRVLAQLEARGVFCRRVKVDVASHSPQVDPLLGELRARLEQLKPRSAQLSMYSTVTGALVEGAELGAGYWVDNLREPVRFGFTVQGLLREGCTHFIEISPHPLLLTAVEQLRADLGVDGIAVGSLRRDQPERRTLLEALGVLYVHGHPLDLERLFPGARRRVPLPTYPWQRKSYWLKSPEAGQHSAGVSTGHPLLRVRIPRAGVDAAYECVLSTQDASWLTDHKLCGQTLVPAPALGELIRAGAEDHAQGAAYELANLTLQTPLVLPASGALRVQVTISDRSAKASVHSQPARAELNAGWTLHATADLDLMPDLTPGDLDLQGCRQRCSTEMGATELYDALGARGLEYGASLRGLRRLWRGPREALAELELACAPDDHYPLHPALLEAAVQALTVLSGAAPGVPTHPSELGRVAIYRAGARSALAHLELQAAAAKDVLARVTLTEPSGAIIAELGPARVRAVDLRAGAEPRGPAASDALFHLVWRELRPAAPVSQLSGTWRILSAAGNGGAERLARELAGIGAKVEALGAGAALELAATDHLVCLFDADGENPAEAALRAAVLALTVAQAATRQGRAPRIWWITCRAAPVREQEDVRPEAAPVWGLGRTVLQERVELPLVLLDVESDRSIASVLLAELSAADEENQVAWRDGKRFAARLVRAPGAASPVVPRRSGEQDGTALITGMFNASVAAMARELIQRGIKHLLLVTHPGGRESADAQHWIAELEALGGCVTVTAADVADRPALAELLGSIPERQPLRAVVHAAAASEDALLPDQTAARLTAAMGPQVRGAWNLHLLTERLELEHFILFSSLSATLGSASQCAAAAGSAFFDALAAHRRAQRRTATSIAWGPWWERGLPPAQREAQRSRLARMGIGMISPQQGQALSKLALDRPESHLLVVPMDLRTLAKAAESAVPSLWRSLLRTSVARAKAAPRDWAKELMALPAEQRFASVLSLVRGAVAAILSLSSPEAVPADKALRDLGLDSLMAVELRNSLARRTGVSSRATLAFDVALSTPATIAQRLLDTLFEDGAPFHARSFVQDGVLSPALSANPHEPEWANPKRVLLTGATGFLGAFLLSELLQQTSARVTCLVRASDARAGAARVAENLERYGLWREAARDRIDVVIGELTEPHLGTSHGVWSELAQTVDSVYSNASHVSYVATYEELRPSHVGATNEILRLVCAGRPKVLNHVSSIAAYDSRSYRGLDLAESAIPEVGVGFHLPYSQCKWASESLVRQAGLRGVPVVIYRPGFIGGSSTTGAWSAGDFLCRLFASIIQQESFPSDLDVFFDFSPADYVARSMVFLSRRPASRGRAFNLQNPSGIPFDSVREILLDLGYRVTPMSYLRWLDVLSERRDPALYPLLPFLRDPASIEGHSNLELAQRKFRPRLSCKETVRALAEGGITCPAIDHALICRYLDYMAERDLIPAVPAHALAKSPENPA